jgi:hypothetical protein
MSKQWRIWSVLRKIRNDMQISNLGHHGSLSVFLVKWHQLPQAIDFSSRSRNALKDTYDDQKARQPIWSPNQVETLSAQALCAWYILETLGGGEGFSRSIGNIWRNVTLTFGLILNDQFARLIALIADTRKGIAAGAKIRFRRVKAGTMRIIRGGKASINQSNAHGAKIRKLSAEYHLLQTMGWGKPCLLCHRPRY